MNCEQKQQTSYWSDITRSTACVYLKLLWTWVQAREWPAKHLRQRMMQEQALRTCSCTAAKCLHAYVT